jgi:hypothetical protein
LIKNDPDTACKSLKGKCDKSCKFCSDTTAAAAKATTAGARATTTAARSDRNKPFTAKVNFAYKIVVPRSDMHRIVPALKKTLCVGSSSCNTFKKELANALVQAGIDAKNNLNLKVANAAVTGIDGPCPVEKTKSKKKLRRRRLANTPKAKATTAKPVKTTVAAKRSSLPGILDIVFSSDGVCPSGYSPAGHSSVLSGNLHQNNNVDLPQFMCLKYGMAKDDETYIQDVHFTRFYSKCFKEYTAVPFGSRQFTNLKYHFVLCVKRGVTKPLQGLFLSHTARCPSMFTGMGLRGGANYLHAYTGNFNQGVSLSTPVFLCQSSATKTPATHSKKDDVLVVMGSNFAKSGNKVTVGGVDCPVKSESEVELRCSISDVLAGHGKVLVTIPGMGRAIPRINSGVNVALHKPVTTNAVVKHWGPLQSVTDGFRYEDTQNYRTCAVFEKEAHKQNMFITVDLGSKQTLHSVDVFRSALEQRYLP